MNNYMWSKVLILAIAIFFVVPALSPAQMIFEQKAAVSENDYEIEFEITFSEEDLIFDTFMEYDTVELREGARINEIGKPMLPAKEIKIALPAGMTVEDIRVVDTQSMVIEGEYDVFPAQPPRRLDGSDDNAPFVEPDANIYNSIDPYPSILVDFVHQTDLSGQGMAVIHLYPVQYVPLEKKLTLYTSLTFLVTGVSGYKCGDYLPSTISEEGKKTYEQMIKDVVINPEDVELHMAPGYIPVPLDLPPGGPYDHVIISRSTDTSYWQTLADWHTKRGLKDIVVTTTWIYGEYSGSDNQQRIRNFIIDAHSTWGTMYFLLCGENGDVPFKYQTYEGESIPSDEYYGDYDNDWTYEVYVGRSTARGSTEVNRFVNKVLKYEKDPPLTNYILDITLLGMDLTTESEPPWYTLTRGQNLKELIDNYIPVSFTVTKVYDTDSGNHRTAFLNALNDGQNLVNHVDHGDTTVMCTGDRRHGLYISNGDVDALTNTNRMSNVFTVGCHCNEMDYNDCIGEHFVIYNDYKAGVSFTGNTRSGWFYVGYPDSLSGRLDRYWWRAIFNYNKYKLGEALAHTKQYCSHSDDVEKYCHWTLNLLGEPEMTLWTDTPETLTVTHDATIDTENQAFNVHVYSSGNVQGATVCLWKGDEVYEVDTTDSSGWVYFTINPTTEGTMSVTVTKHNYLPYEGETTVQEAGDTNPPEPSPLTWAVLPHPISSSAISMTATTATDETPPIYYFFDFYSGGSGGTDSSWQTTISYTDSGLQPNTQYSYRTKAKDSANPANEGQYSTIESTYTFANVPSAPSVTNPTSSTIDVNVNPNGNPSLTGFAILCDSTSPYDATWEGKYVNANGDPVASGVWQTDASWGTITVRGLNGETQYCFTVKARNQNLVETVFGPQGCGQTETPMYVLDGYCTYQDMSPVNTVGVKVVNLNTGISWMADTTDNHYSLELQPGEDIYVDDVLRLIAKDGVEWINVTDHIVTQVEMDSGGATEDLILNEFYLDLTDFPMYQAESPYNEMCGPAVAQMALNYMWWNSSQDPEPPMTFDDQSWLYDRGIENNSDPGLPYFDLQGMWYTIQYNKPMPYSEYGYNFLKRHNADQDEMLKQICQWINYTVGTIGGYKEGHPLHVPSIVPAYGDYSNWMAVRGIHTDGYTYPMPDELTVYGFWMNDPYPASLGGIGENSYKTGNEFVTYYYNTMTVGDYIGEYLAVLEPPEIVENCELKIAESKPRFNGLQKYLIRWLLNMDDVPDQIQQMADQTVIQAAIDGVREQLIPYDEGFAELFEKTVPGKPMFIPSIIGNNYYAIPFNLLSDNNDENDKTVIVILIDAYDGSFQEASWVNEPIKYLPVTREDARQIAYELCEELGIEVEDINDLHPGLIHMEKSPYYPHWQVLIENYGIYISQDGTTSYVIFK